MGEVIEFDGRLDELIAAASQPVTRELKRILALLRDGCPAKSQISFDFDGKLHAHVDVRKIEEAAAVEAVLPTLGEACLVL